MSGERSLGDAQGGGSGRDSGTGCLAQGAVSAKEARGGYT